VNVVEKPDLANLEDVVGGSGLHTAISSQNNFVDRTLTSDAHHLDSEGHGLYAGDARGATGDVFDADLEGGFDSAPRSNQNVFAFPGKFVAKTVESRVVSIAPGGAGAGAFAGVAFPFAGLAGARFAVPFDRATWRKYFAAVFALAIGLEDALPGRVPHVIVGALTASDAFFGWVADLISI